MSKEKERILFLDYLRVLAIICVLLCHSTQAVYVSEYGFEPDYLKSLSVQSKYMLLTLFSCGRIFGVPIFLMITGNLLLGKEYNDEKIVRFWKNNWLHLVICTMIWFLIYDLFLLIRHEQNFLPQDIIRDMLFLHKVNFVHVWYMPMIIGFYLLIPFVSNAILAVKNSKIMLFPIIFVFYLGSIIPFINLYILMYGKDMFESQINLGYSGGIYGLYILLGYYYKKDWKLGKWQKTVLLLIVLMSVTISVLLINKMMNANLVVDLWYDSPVVIIGSVVSYILAMQIKYPSKITNAVIWLSRYSFAVYLIHMLIKCIVLEYITGLKINKPMQVVVLEIVMLTGGYAIAFLISKIPKVGKYILYIK